MTLPARISADPNPVQQGKPLIVCYNFDGATSPVTLTLHWDPPPSTQITLSSGDSCKAVVVPANAEGLIIEDESGQSEDKAVQVV